MIGTAFSLAHAEGKTHRATLSILRIVSDVISQTGTAAVNQTLLSGETIDVVASS